MSMTKRATKRVVALVLALMMVAMMGVTAFADTTTVLSDGTHTATATLYKDSACTTLSMGNDALTTGDSNVTIEVKDGLATLSFSTKDLTVTRLGITVTGKLASMVLYDADAGTYTATTEDDGYTFVISKVPVKYLIDGVVFEGTFKATVSIIETNMSGYLQLTNIK